MFVFNFRMIFVSCVSAGKNLPVKQQIDVVRCHNSAALLRLANRFEVNVV